MRNLVILFFILSIGQLFSQNKQAGIQVKVFANAAVSLLEITIKSDADSLTECNVKILDAKNNTVKTAALPKSAYLLKASIPYYDLIPGSYLCVVYKGDKELEKGPFTTDYIMMGKMTQLQKPFIKELK